MKGGEILGQGTYGCVFTPPPQCLPAPARAFERPVIGKIFAKKHHINEELAMAKILRKIDPVQRYFVYPIHACETRMRDIARDPSVGECAFIGATQTDPDQTFAMAIMPRVNASMIRMVMAEKIRPADYARAIAPVFKGVELLARNKIVHNDLKFDNILYDAHDRVFKIIDFGISVNMKDAFKNKENRYIDTNYWLHPPEYRAWSYLLKKYPTGNWPRPLPVEEIRGIFKSHLDILRIPMTREVNLRKMLLELHNFCDYEREFIDWVQKLTTKGDIAAAEAYINKYANRIDLYAMGLNIMICLRFMDREQDPEVYKKLVDLATNLTAAVPFRRIAGAEL